MNSGMGRSLFFACTFVLAGAPAALSQAGPGGPAGSIAPRTGTENGSAADDHTPDAANNDPALGMPEAAAPTQFSQPTSENPTIGNADPKTATPGTMKSEAAATDTAASGAAPAAAAPATPPAPPVAVAPVPAPAPAPKAAAPALSAADARVLRRIRRAVAPAFSAAGTPAPARVKVSLRRGRFLLTGTARSQEEKDALGAKAAAAAGGRTVENRLVVR